MDRVESNWLARIESHHGSCASCAAMAIADAGLLLALVGTHRLARTTGSTHGTAREPRVPVQEYRAIGAGLDIDESGDIDEWHLVRRGG